MTSTLGVSVYRITVNYNGDGNNTLPEVRCCRKVMTESSGAAELIIDNLPPGVAGVSDPGDVSFSCNWAQSGASGRYGANGSLYSFDDISVLDVYTWRNPVLNATQSP